MKNTFKVCIVGCGVISANHIVSLLRLDNVSISALCDIDLAKAKARKDEFGLDCSLYTDYIDMLETETPDAVHILTPHYLHVPMTLEALSRNVNVLLEKPMCIKEADIEKLISAERNSSARVCVSFQTRYNRTTERALAIANDDGGATGAFGTLMWKRDDEYYASGEWRGKWDTEGGGALINQSIHTIDLLCNFLGIPEKIQSTVSTLRHSKTVEVEDSAFIIIDFANGKRGNIFATTTYSGQDTTTLHVETKNNVIEIRGSSLYVNSQKIDDADCDEYMGKKCYGNSHIILIAKFYDALTSGSPMPISLESASHATKIVLSAYRSDSKIIDIS